MAAEEASPLAAAAAVLVLALVSLLESIVNSESERTQAPSR